MARILILPFPLASHVNPTIQIAKAARNKGHEVLYSTLLDMEDVIRAEGFAFVPAFEDVFPKGLMAQSLARLSELKGLKRLLLARKLIQRDRRMNEAFLAGVVERTIRDLQPDLLLCDDALVQTRIIAQGSGVPTLVLNVSLPAQRRPEPAPTPGALAAPRRWFGGVAREAMFQALSLLSLPSPVTLRKTLRLLAARHHYPPAPEGSGDFDLGRPEIPEAMLCPPEFAEAPESPGPGRREYLGPCVNLERPLPAFPWERLEEGRPLVLCSMGTMAVSYEESLRFFQRCLRAATLRPDWGFVLHTANVDPTVLGALPPHLIAARSVPMIPLLERASAMITHGGFNSVKECIYFGVPMLALPRGGDTHRVADRLVHHGLGLRGSMAELDAPGLVAHLDELIGSPAIRSALAAMRARFRETNSDDFIVATLERYLARGPVTTPVAAHG